jgi:hypothetical protein
VANEVFATHEDVQRFIDAEFDRQLNMAVHQTYGISLGDQPLLYGPRGGVLTYA